VVAQAGRGAAVNRGLFLVLALVGGLSLYLSNQSDDELLAPSRQQGGRPATQANRGDQGEKGGRGDQTASSRSVTTLPRSVDKRAPAMEPWQAEGLTQGVTRWQARLAGQGKGVSSAGDPSAWRSMQPPPPPRVVVANAPPPPPPPPMAPRFPHAWVGRFNDEAVASAASGASAPAPRGIARAVLTGPQSTWVVRAGDVIEGQWRVDRIQDRTMSLTYLPLQQRQTVVMR